MTSNHEAGGAVTTVGSYMIGSEPQFQGMPICLPSYLIAFWLVNCGTRSPKGVTRDVSMGSSNPPSAISGR